MMMIKNAVRAPVGHDHKEDSKEGWSGEIHLVLVNLSRHCKEDINFPGVSVGAVKTLTGPPPRLLLRCFSKS